MFEIEILGGELLPDGPEPGELRALCELVLEDAGVAAGHLAVEFVDERRIARLNGEHRGRPLPTDVLSFPIDGVEEFAGAPRELGDVVICPGHTRDISEAVVHGVLHLLGMDHETDKGEMLARQAALLERASGEWAAGGWGGGHERGPMEAHLSRSGFVAVAGRPNVGKSTLVNAIVGRKVAIVSDRPQTTRRAIRGVWTQDERQVVLVDLPGVQRPRDGLTARMARRVREELEGADAALLILDGEQGAGPGDRFIAARLAGASMPTTVAVNKVDRLDRAGIAAALLAAAELGLEGDIFPVSARTGAGVGELIAHLASQMPVGAPLFTAGQRSDQSRERFLGELVREAVIRRTFQEVPHAVEVMVEEIERTPAELTRVRALIWVESDSQKAIVVGAGGRMIKAIGTAARREIEHELAGRVHLDLSVRVRRDWRGDESLLDRLGIV